MATLKSLWGITKLAKPSDKWPQSGEAIQGLREPQSVHPTVEGQLLLRPHQDTVAGEADLILREVQDLEFYMVLPPCAPVLFCFFYVDN